MVIEEDVPDITLVDDEKVLLDVLSRAARGWDYTCQAAKSAEEALQVLERRPTPILVTDLHMPGKGGLWLVREVKLRWPDMGIIVLTAGQDINHAVDCLNAGAYRYFLKPIHLDEFRHALDSTMENYRLRCERMIYQRHLEKRVRWQTQKIRGTFLSAINSLVLTLEARDPYTSGHSERVCRYGLALGRAIGLNRHELRQALLAAKLHDIGKVGVPEAILTKSSSLTEEEWGVIKTHTLVGEQILRPIIHSKHVLAAVRGHHERLDGKGYPDGLTAENIPTLARIISVVDTFDALTSNRPYRAPLSVREAAEELRRSRGAQLDPILVETFLELIAENPALVQTGSAGTLDPTVFAGMGI